MRGTDYTIYMENFHDKTADTKLLKAPDINSVHTNT